MGISFGVMSGRDCASDKKLCPYAHNICNWMPQGMQGKLFTYHSCVLECRQLRWRSFRKRTSFGHRWWREPRPLETSHSYREQGEDNFAYLTRIIICFMAHKHHNLIHGHNPMHSFQSYRLRAWCACRPMSCSHSCSCSCNIVVLHNCARDKK